MAQTLKINTQHVAELLPSLTPRTTTKARFKFDMPAQDILDLLAAAYSYEVEDRGGTLRLDDHTADAITRLAGALAAQSPKNGIICCGTPGNGKTTLLKAFQRALNYLRLRGHFRRLTDADPAFRPAMQIVRATELARMVNSREYDDLMKRSMLGIDDLGEEPAEVMSYGTLVSPMRYLLEYRYERQLFTFITTNLTPAQLKQKYGLRIADRFNEMLHKIIFRGPTFRT